MFSHSASWQVTALICQHSGQHPLPSCSLLVAGLLLCSLCSFVGAGNPAVIRRAMGLQDDFGCTLFSLLGKEVTAGTPFKGSAGSLSLLGKEVIAGTPFKGSAGSL